VIAPEIAETIINCRGGGVLGMWGRGGGQGSLAVYLVR
jgi:hypothetical protein